MITGSRNTFRTLILRRQKLEIDTESKGDINIGDAEKIDFDKLQINNNYLWIRFLTNYKIV